MFKSIRWSLLVGFAVILAATICAFGATLYYNQRRSMFREVDSALQAHARTLAVSIETDKKGKLEVDLPDEYVRSFGTGDDAPYFAVWDRAGAVVESSLPRADVPPSSESGARTRGSRREILLRGPEGALVLVGRKIKDQQEKLRELLGAVIAIGGGVMIFALAGGWLLAGRALKPIERISGAASAISASNLSQRIDVAQTESELGKLARTLNEAFDRLERAFERQTRFTADASHELRTPLSIVLTQAELALSKERSPAEHRDAHEITRQAAQRMKAVVEGLLTLARADSRELNLRKEKVDLQAVVEETCSLLGPMAIEKKVALTASADRIDVIGDPDRLREVLMNLLTNAIRYNRMGGRVDVALEDQGGDAVLTVADTGIGIPEKDQPHLFERFFRVDKARSREQGGCGLGLSISKWIVEAHGGTLSFVSREDSGTTFTLKFPKDK